MKIVYFAWLRERIGRPEEEITLPAEARTVADVVNHLVGLGEEYAYAFEEREFIRAALDRRHAKPEAPIAGAREIAFFPPMTGG